jgi:hypothetical protein
MFSFLVGRPLYGHVVGVVSDGLYCGDMLLMLSSSSLRLFIVFGCCWLCQVSSAGPARNLVSYSEIWLANQDGDPVPFDHFSAISIIKQDAGMSSCES